jgi:MraZ protein
MELLTGEFRGTLDEKGRISLPASLRRILNEEKLKITQCDNERCLWIFPASAYSDLINKVSENTNLLAVKDRAFRRRLFNSHEVEIDKAGRIQIAQNCRDFANLSKECVILGQGELIEIWDEELYRQYLERSEEDYFTVSEELGHKLKNTGGSGQ